MGNHSLVHNELLEAWEDFLGKKLSCVDRPGAVYNPDINDQWPDEDIITIEEFDV